MRRLLIALLPALLLYAPATPAQDIEGLERQLEQARDAAPMVVKPFTASTRKAKYFGDYEPRKGNEFKRGEEMFFSASSRTSRSGRTPRACSSRRSRSTSR